MHIDNGQITRIKAEVRRLGIDDTEYRHLLNDFYGVSSCKHLSRMQAADFISRLGSIRPRPLPYEDLAGRPGMAQPKQLRMLMAMFAEVSDAPPAQREERFNAFLKARFNGLSGLRWLEEKDIRRVAKALKSMKVQAEKKATKINGLKAGLVVNDEVAA